VRRKEREEVVVIEAGAGPSAAVAVTTVPADAAETETETGVEEEESLVTEGGAADILDREGGMKEEAVRVRDVGWEAAVEEGIEGGEGEGEGGGGVWEEGAPIAGFGVMKYE